MAVSYNRVILAGNLTRKPETRNIGGDKSVTNFGLAVNERYKGKDGETKESVTFIDIEAWNKTGQLVEQYLDKGSSCLIEGKLKLDSWDDKDGQKRTKLKVIADSVQFLNNKTHGDSAQPVKPAPGAATADDWNP